MDNKTYVIGLTGQSGSGKTLVSDHLKNCGYSVINADLVARQVTETGSDCNKNLAKIFPECFDEKFCLNRRKLGNVVFNDGQKLKMLNDTIFPYINRLIKEQINSHIESGVKVIVLDAPTLFEAGADKLCDIIISVVADDAVRLERIRGRDNISDESIKARFSSQKSKEFYLTHSDIILENNGTAEELLEYADRIFGDIKAVAEGQANGAKAKS